MPVTVFVRCNWNLVCYEKSVGCFHSAPNSRHHSGSKSKNGSGLNSGGLPLDKARNQDIFKLGML